MAFTFIKICSKITVVAEKYVLDITQCSKKRGKKEKQKQKDTNNRRKYKRHNKINAYFEITKLYYTSNSFDRIL